MNSFPNVNGYSLFVCVLAGESIQIFLYLKLSCLVVLVIMIKPHSLKLPVQSSKFFLTIFLVVLVVAVFRIPALEGEDDSDIIVILSDSLDKEAVLPRGLDSITSSGVKLTVEPSPKTVVVSTTFDIDIWLRNVQQPLDGYAVILKLIGDRPDVIEVINISLTDVNIPITHDVRVATIRFHCLGLGSVRVEVRPDSYVIIDSTQFGVIGVDGFIHQTIVIGGITMPTNKLTILSPYIALAGLIITVSAVMIKKRK